MPNTTLKHRLLAGLAVTLLGAVTATPVLAAPTEQAQVVNFNIQAGPLDAALQAFAAQSGRQISFAPDLVANLKTTGVRGADSRNYDRGLPLGSTSLSQRRRPAVAKKSSTRPIAVDIDIATSLSAELLKVWLERG